MTQSAAFTIQQPRMKATVKAYMRLSFSTHRATIEQFGCVWIQNLAPNKEIGNLVGNKEIQKVCALLFSSNPHFSFPPVYKSFFLTTRPTHLTMNDPAGCFLAEDAIEDFNCCWIILNLDVNERKRIVC